MRGSTRLAEARLPFDTVFLINRFLRGGLAGGGDGGGQPNQFVGDGLLALFGLHADPATACRQANPSGGDGCLKRRIHESRVRQRVAGADPVRHRIHAGEVIIGDIGFRDHTVFTALGDAVNVAARLQDMTKALIARSCLGGGLQERRHCAGQADETRCRSAAANQP